MKNTSFFTTLLCFVFLSFSCTKNNVEPTVSKTPTASVSSKNDRMVFETMDDYEQLLTIDPNKRIEILQSKNPSSLAKPKCRTTVNINSYDSPFLQQLLNHDAVVEIGSWIIKVDMEAGHVYALNNIYEKEYNDLITLNTQNPHVLTFSTDENVLELLQSQEASASSKLSGLSCKDRQADGKKMEGYDIFNADGTQRADCKVVYQKAGIYFSLQGKVKIQEKIAGVWIDRDWAEMTMYYDYNYSIRCGAYRSSSYYVKESGNSVSHRPYESTKGLEHYYFNIYADIPVDNGTYFRTLSYSISD